MLPFRLLLPNSNRLSRLGCKQSFAINWSKPICGRHNNLQVNCGASQCGLNLMPAQFLDTQMQQTKFLARIPYACDYWLLRSAPWSPTMTATPSSLDYLTILDAPPNIIIANILPSQESQLSATSHITINTSHACNQQSSLCENTWILLKRMVPLRQESNLHDLPGAPGSCTREPVEPIPPHPLRGDVHIYTHTGGGVTPPQYSSSYRITRNWIFSHPPPEEWPLPWK